MTHWMLTTSMVALVLTTMGCNLTGPSEPLTGTWTASLGKFSFVGISLQQDGDDIAGTACARSDGVLLYSGVPVRGDHPRISFEVASTNTQPCCAHLAGTRFSGRQDSTEDIVGRLGRVDIRFERSNTSVCNQAGD
jgi:hypothetical protein